MGRKDTGEPARKSELTVLTPRLGPRADARLPWESGPRPTRLARPAGDTSGTTGRCRACERLGKERALGHCLWGPGRAAL